jgi:hypothetical protein
MMLLLEQDTMSGSVFYPPSFNLKQAVRQKNSIDGHQNIGDQDFDNISPLSLLVIFFITVSSILTLFYFSGTNPRNHSWNECCNSR